MPVGTFFRKDLHETSDVILKLIHLKLYTVQPTGAYMYFVTPSPPPPPQEMHLDHMLLDLWIPGFLRILQLVHSIGLLFWDYYQEIIFKVQILEVGPRKFWIVLSASVNL